MTVGGFGMPFALLLKAQNPPVTGVFIVKSSDVAPDYQFGGLLLGSAKIRDLLKQIQLIFSRCSVFAVFNCCLVVTVLQFDSNCLPVVFD